MQLQIHHPIQKCLVPVTHKDSESEDAEKFTRLDKSLSSKEVTEPRIMPCPSRHDRRSEHGAKLNMGFDTAFPKCDADFAPSASTNPPRSLGERDMSHNVCTWNKNAKTVTLRIPTTRYALSVGGVERKVLAVK